MRTIKEIKSDIKSVKADMKSKGVRVVSCFNGGLTESERCSNSELFNLKTELIAAIADAAKA